MQFVFCEIAEICRNLGLKNVGEAKCYPRDWLTPGRVRVELKDANGNSVHPEIKTKKQLMEISLFQSLIIEIKNLLQLDMTWIQELQSILILMVKM